MKLRLALNTERKCEWEKVKSILDQVEGNSATVQSAILKYLSEGPRTAHEIMTHLLSQEHYATKGSVHKALSDIRERLERFYQSPAGFRERSRLELPKCAKSRQSLRVTDNIPRVGATAFWAGHLANGLMTELVVGGRSLRIKNDISIRGENGEVLKVWRDDDPRPTQDETSDGVETFVSLPNVEAMFHLFMYFRAWHEEYGQPAPRVRNDIPTTVDHTCNRVILGTPFENELILDDEIYAEGRNESCLFFNADGTRFRKTAANGEHRVLVSRHWHPTNVETTIAASEGPALKAVCEHLTSERFERTIRERWSNRKWRGFPPEFRMEFRVKLTDDRNGIESIRLKDYEEMAGWMRKVGSSGQVESYVGPTGEWSWPW